MFVLLPYLCRNMTNEEYIIQRFGKRSFIEQTFIYAEALKREWYELLAIIDKCVSDTNRTKFLQAVELWLE